MGETVYTALARLSGEQNRLSRAYKALAWLSLAGVFVWPPFGAAAGGFYLGGYLLRREGL